MTLVSATSLGLLLAHLSAHKITETTGSSLASYFYVLIWSELRTQVHFLAVELLTIYLLKQTIACHVADSIAALC